MRKSIKRATFFIVMFLLLIFFMFLLYKHYKKQEKIRNENLINERRTTQWKKYSSKQILGNDETGTLFDPACIIDGNQNERFKMYVSKRNEGSIVLYTSEDGVNFNPNYTTIIAPESSSQYVYNRPSVLKHNGKYYLYYTRQILDVSSEIYYGVSEDGVNFNFDPDPVIIPTEEYEKNSVMNPNVIYDEKKQEFRMYYVSGEIIEPDHICIVTSKDGKNWKKRIEPILSKNPNINSVDYYKVGATDVHYLNDKYYVFYIGYTDISTARILLLTSEDGINFFRDSYRIIVEPDVNGFDSKATYKPSVVYDEKTEQWFLYYNGRSGAAEYIGLYIKKGPELE